MPVDEQKSLSQLETLHLKCLHIFQLDEDWHAVKYPGQANEFCSPFWIARQCILEAKIEPDMIIYSILKYKYNQWKQMSIIHSTA